MSFKPIVESRRIKRQGSERRRPRAECRLSLESLENRTPLSGGLAAVVEPSFIFSAVEFALVAREDLAATDSASSPANVTPIFSAENSPFLLQLPTITQVLASDGAAAPEGVLLTPASAPGTDFIGVPPLPSMSAVIAASGESPVLDQREKDAAAFADAPNLFPIGPDPAAPIDDAGNPDRGDGPFGGIPNPFLEYFLGVTGPAMLHGSSQAGDDDTDMTFAGTLENIDTLDESSQSTTPLSSNVRAPGRSWGFFLAEPVVLNDSSGEIASASVLSYLASGGRSNFDSGLSAAVVDAVFSGEDNLAEPVLPASITTGGVSLNVLLGGPDLPGNADARGVEQVAQLVPLPETSLALAATLWTVSADTPTDARRSESQSAKPAVPDGSPDTASAWAVFVTGMDQALEQTCRDIRDGVLSGQDRRPLDGTDSSTGPRGLIEWQGPILPAVRAGWPNRAPASPRPASSRVPAPSARQDLGSSADSGGSSDDGPSVMLGGMPVLSILSLSTAVAGWFWSRRRREKTAARSHDE